MMKVVLSCLLLGMTLGGCSAPETPRGAYAQDAAVSNAAGVPHDSATSYFPPSARPTAGANAAVKRFDDCRFMTDLLSKDLFWFDAPVLSNYYLGHATYRFLWAPAFRLPVVLTLELSETGGVLKTRLVNRYPAAMDSPAQVEARAKPLLKRIGELKTLIEAGREVPANTERLASARQRLADARLGGTPLIITEQAVVLSRRQVQQFIELLEQANFWQLASCAPSDCFDGANYTLEAHEAHRYHMVSRGCSVENSVGLYRCCRYLLALSPAQPREHN